MNNDIVRITAKSTLAKANRNYDKGFTLIEMLIVMSILSAFSFSGIFVVRNYIAEVTQNQLVHDQQRALALRQHQDVDLEPTIERFSEVWFNAKGNINTAQTLRFGETSKLVIQLGPGRMHE